MSTRASTPLNRAERYLYLVFALTVVAAYAPAIIAEPQAFVRPQGMALLALGVFYLICGTYGHWSLVRVGTRVAVSAYFSIQLVMAAAIGFLSEGSGAFWLVMFPLLAQAVIGLPRPGVAAVAAGVWGIFTAVGVVNAGVREGILASLSFMAAVAFVMGVSYLLVQERRGKAEVERLAAELGEANRQLEAYAAQAEDLAAARERNRLARDLHDSATQTMFSMTLTAQAAEILLDRDPAKVRGQLQRLRELAQAALAEMRTLVQHLRPAVTDEALVPALREHLEALRVREGVAVDLDVKGALDLSREQTEGLFRIVQEALNNVVKHAGTKTATVTLRAEDGEVRATVEDRGAGFDPALAAAADGHFGMAGMRERAEILRGALSVVSSPGEGTRVTVRLPRISREGRSE